MGYVNTINSPLVKYTVIAGSKDLKSLKNKK